MAGLPSGSKDSKDTPAYLKQGGILWFLFRQAACQSREIAVLKIKIKKRL